ncbi:MFS transporter [Candidatus Methanosphaera massiliense]|jgi:DHA1 family inner membrane transport protein|uniref:MFS transporter n=1 Tax=Candidatus Methanosphaera massiliense TaxID=3017187 RepID=UPI000DC30CC4|nr:MFS transporter [Candidatus Methanosphaera massiliense]MDD6285804.1 MFS transporter [Methanobacteriaceae archaeon]MDE4078117.1 MFS transporter [Candidatus Methanosphaera massiliense]RAP43496.1 MAG: MFS transporter [Methanosphaera sp. SHI1033]
MNREDLIIYIMVLGTFGILSTEMGVVGILPQIAQYFNVSITQAGLFVSMFSLTIAIFAIFMPVIFSKYERKKTFLLVLTIFTVFTTIGAFVHDFNIALICRIIPAMFHPIYCSISMTVAAEIVEPEKTQSAVSKVIMGVSAGMIIGVPITTFIATNFGYQYAMLWFAIINLIVLILTLIFFPKIPGKEQSYLDQVSVAKTGVFIISVLGVIFLNAGLYTGYSYISEFLGTLTHIAGTNLSIVLFIYGVASIIGNWLGSRLLVKDARKLVLLSPIIISLILLGVFIACNNAIPTIIFMALWGLLAGIFNDISQYWMVSSAPQAPEFANGIFLSMGNVGVTLGTTLAGIVVAGIGIRYVMLFAILVLMLDLILLFTRTKRYDID